MKASRFSTHRIVHGLLYMALTISVILLFYFVKAVFKDQHRHHNNHSTVMSKGVKPTQSL